MKQRYLPILFFLLALCLQMVSAQPSVILGRLVDDHDDPLIGANVYLEGTILGSATDNDGIFQITRVPGGSYVLVTNLIGFKEVRRTVSVTNGLRLDMGNITVASTVIATEPVVVTAGKYEQKIQDIPASVSTISKEELQYRNTITIDDALAYVSGVNLNGSQISIRGSTGYSQGAGSRVLMLLDGIPILTADTGDIVYSVVPTYLVERIEVLKGAGSALYGSSALGGVVNVITKTIDAAPRFHLRTYGGTYSEPSFDDWRWTGDTHFKNGFNASYSQRFGDVRVLLGAARDQDDSYRRNDWSRRWSGSGKLQWDISPYRRLTLSGNYMRQKRGNFLYWQGLNNALEPFPGQEDDEVISKRYYVTANYQHIISKRQFLTFRSIWYWNRALDSVSDGPAAGSTASNLNSELQYNTQLGNIFLTSGIEGTFNKVESDRFGDHNGAGNALYMQGEIPLSAQWRVTLGWRFDYFDIDSLDSDSRLNPKLGIVFQPAEGTALRAAAGTGYRAPSMAEAFTSTVAGGIQVVPNTTLLPEKSRYLEVGANQILNDWLIADAALFYSRFDDFIEPGFLPRGVIQFRNVVDARIRGLEASLSGQLWRRSAIWQAGYTFIDSQNLDIRDYLNFRPRHIFYGKIQLRTGDIRLGADYRFISKYDRIDENLALFIPDADARVATHTLDLRLGTALSLSGTPLNISLQLDNALNYNYLDFVGSPAPPRRLTATLDVTL